jgi:hypothetical protein
MMNVFREESGTSDGFGRGYCVAVETVNGYCDFTLVDGEKDRMYRAWI